MCTDQYQSTKDAHCVSFLVSSRDDTIFHRRPAESAFAPIVFRIWVFFSRTPAFPMERYSCFLQHRPSRSKTRHVAVRSTSRFNLHRADHRNVELSRARSMKVNRAKKCRRLFTFLPKFSNSLRASTCNFYIEINFSSLEKRFTFNPEMHRFESNITRKTGA